MNTKKTAPFLFIFAYTHCVFFLLSGVSGAHELLDYIEIALKQSDAAYDIEDLRKLSNLSVDVEKYQFDYQLVPLANIGFAKITGSQTLGMEVKQKNTFGTQITAGLRADQTDLNTGYSVEDSNIAKAYLHVSQGLFRTWGKKYNLAGLNIAMLKKDEQTLQNERLRQDLILRTASEYYQLVLAQQLIEQSKQAFERSKEHLEAATSRQSVGLVSKVDVYRAELAALAAENNLQSEMLALRGTQDVLSQTLGIEDDQSVQPKSPIQLLQPVVPDDWEEALLNNRLDWQAYKINSKYAQINLFRAQRDTLPDISLNFGVEQKGEGESFSDSIDLDQTNWWVQLEMRSTLDLFNEKANLVRENINKHKLDREGKSLRKKILREATEAFENLQIQGRFYTINIRRTEQAEQALDLTKTRYQRGISDNLDVLDAENAYSTAKLDVSKAMISYNIAALKLAYSLGVLDVEWLKYSIIGGKENLVSSSQLTQNSLNRTEDKQP